MAQHEDEKSFDLPDMVTALDMTRRPGIISILVVNWSIDVPLQFLAVLWISKYSFRIPIRGSVILNYGSGMVVQLITAPVRSGSYLHIFLANGKKYVNELVVNH